METDEAVKNAPTAPVVEEPAGTPEPKLAQPVQSTPQPGQQGLVEFYLDELETALFDAANDARRAKIAPVEKQYLEVKAQADARFDESIIKVLKRHGLSKVPDKYGCTLRDPQGNLITPCKFSYIPDAGTPTAQPERSKLIDKLAGKSLPKKR